MLTAFRLFSVVSMFSLLALAQTGNTTYYGATDITSNLQEQTWNFDLGSRCRLFSHQSIVLKNDRHHLLVFDGGIAKFRYKYQGKDVEVLDLNSWTTVVDLSKRFNTHSFGVLSHARKSLDVPVTTRYSLWADSNQDSIIMQGGHFYNNHPWNRSSYFVPKPNLPPYSVWKFDLGRSWRNITGEVNIGANFVRAVGGAGVSVPRINMSFYIGGIHAPRSARTAPDLQMIPQGGMMIFDHSTSKLTNATFGDPGNTMAFWHGALNHLPIGKEKGFLISLMGEMALAGVPREDLPYQSDERGDPVSFRYVMLYNIATRSWINQSTKAWDGNYPVPRSRFCGKTVFSRVTRTWELWVYGGMLIDPRGDPVQDVYVLTMPSFIWVKIQAPSSEGYSRTHSCEVVGSQLLVLGGYPPSEVVQEEVPCAREFIRILDMNTVSWTSEYSPVPQTEYVTPEIVKREAEFILNRTSPAAAEGWADLTGALEAAFHYGPNPLIGDEPSTLTSDRPLPTPSPSFGDKIKTKIFWFFILLIPVIFI